MLANAGVHCLDCPQREEGVRRLDPDGVGTCGVLICGDSPWIDEMRMGRVFSGAAGYLLDRLIRSLTRDRSEFSITNAGILCKPPMLNWTDKPIAAAALSSCRDYLDEHIAALKPRCIVPMGNVALRRICDVTGIEAHHGYVHSTQYGLAVPTFHPSFLIRGTSGSGDEKARNMRYFPAVIFSLQRALEVASGKFQRQPVEYLLDPKLADAQDYVRRYTTRQWYEMGVHGSECLYNFSYSNVAPSKQRAGEGSGAGRSVAPGPLVGTGAGPLTLGEADVTRPAMTAVATAAIEAGVIPATIPHVFLDLETPESSKLEGQDEEPPQLAGRKLKLAGPIFRASISLWPGTAVSVPWEHPYDAWFTETVRNALSIAGWNSYDADFPKLRAGGVLQPTDRPVEVDAMWAWHFLQTDLPKSLGFVAPFFYDGEAWKHKSESDPALYNAVDSDAGLRCLLGIREALVKQNRWHGFMRHSTAMQPILSRMGFIRIDRDEQARFRTKLQAEYDQSVSELQSMVPKSVKPRKVYKRAPKDMAGVEIVRVPSPLGEEQGLLFDAGGEVPVED